MYNYSNLFIPIFLHTKIIQSKERLTEKSKGLDFGASYLVMQSQVFWFSPLRAMNEALI